MNNEKDFTMKLRNKYFRMILLGKSQSGKTYFLENRIINVFRDDYDKIIIFTDSMNKNSYKERFYPCTVISSKHEEKLKQITDKIKNSFVRNKNGEKLYAKNGDLLRPCNYLFVFDDIFTPKLIKSEIFIELICILRHLQISVIFITQHHEIILNRMMKSQTDIFVLFKTNDTYSRNAFRRIIESALINMIDDRKRKEKAIMLYNEHVLNQDYGKIIIDLNKNKLYAE